MWWQFLIFGALGGVLGGMGMGGGTLLIPLLTLFTKTEQKEAQGNTIFYSFRFRHILLLF